MLYGQYYDYHTPLLAAGTPLVQTKYAAAFIFTFQHGAQQQLVPDGRAVCRGADIQS